MDCICSVEIFGRSATALPARRLETSSLPHAEALRTQPICEILFQLLGILSRRNGIVLLEQIGSQSQPVPTGVSVRLITLLVLIEPQDRLPAARWIDAMRGPVIMSSDKARAELGWRPRYDAMETLRETIAAAFGRGAL